MASKPTQVTREERCNIDGFARPHCHRDTTRGRFDETERGSTNRRLAGARGTDQAQRLTSADIKADVANARWRPTVARGRPWVWICLRQALDSNERDIRVWSHDSSSSDALSPRVHCSGTEQKRIEGLALTLQNGEDTRRGTEHSPSDHRSATPVSFRCGVRSRGAATILLRYAGPAIPPATQP